MHLQSAARIELNISSINFFFFFKKDHWRQNYLSSSILQAAFDCDSCLSLAQAFVPIAYINPFPTYIHLLLTSFSQICIHGFSIAMLEGSRPHELLTFFKRMLLFDLSKSFSAHYDMPTHLSGFPTTNNNTYVNGSVRNIFNVFEKF